MNCLNQFFKGIALGVGAILPGISSGVLCVIFGIYEKLIDSFLGFFNDVKGNLKFLLPLLIGVLVGVVLFGNALQFIFQNYHNLACFCFVGLILGTIPSIVHEAKKATHTQVMTINDTQLKSKCISKFNFQCVYFHACHIIALLLTFSFSIYLLSLEFSNNVAFMQNHSESFLTLMITGFCMSAGIVIPGISSTVILMILGKYSLYLSAVSSLNFSILIPICIGILFGGIILLILIKFSFKYFRDISYFAIIGFILGSIPVLFPHNLSFFELILGIILVVFSSLIIILLEKRKVCK